MTRGTFANVRIKNLMLGGEEGGNTLLQPTGEKLSTHETELESSPRELRGLHHHKPVTLPTHHGVQIELPPRVRGRSPVWAEWSGPGHVPHMRALIDGLAAAARSWTLPA